ncbi:MAG: hypothetical protein M0022_09875 [Desulfobacteraceae bacterium]|nr:hypothetical protein [Desulfobacteraceae bacterium]
MEIIILTAKISNINHKNDIEFKETLIKILNLISDNTDKWQKFGQKLLTTIITRIAREEGIHSFKNIKDENNLKEHIPSDITNTINQLTNISLNSSNIYPTKEIKLTMLFLIIKLIEWIIWNYEGRCIYGNKIDSQAKLLFDFTDNKIELFGNKDEIWICAENILKDIFKQRHILGQKSLFGCHTYAEEASIYKYNQKLILAAQTKAIDQTVFGLSIFEQNYSLNRLNRLEDIILTNLKELCGAS